MFTARPTFKRFYVATGSLIATGVLLTTVFSSTFAQEEALSTNTSLSLTAIPPRLGDDNSLLLKPGEKKQVTIRVSNSSDQTTRLRSMAQDFIVKDDGETPEPLVMQNSDNRWSLASWLTLTPASQTLKPTQSGQITVLIDVPEDAMPGGHYAMITHQPDLGGVDVGENEETSAQNSAVNQRVGTLLYVVVDGDIQENAFIRDFIMPGFLEFGPVPFTFRLENQSDIHISPKIGVEIRNIIGQKVATIQPESKNIFPLTSRTFEGQWDRIWGFGRYTADVVVSYGTQGQVAVASTSFWLLPVKLLIAIIVFLLLLILGGMSIRRHLIHRKQDQTKRIAELESKLHQLESDKLKKFEE